MWTRDDGVGVKYALTWMIKFKTITHIEDWEYESISHLHNHRCICTKMK
jgi:hypothetical protein